MGVHFFIYKKRREYNIMINESINPFNLEKQQKKRVGFYFMT